MKRHRIRLAGTAILALALSLTMSGAARSRAVEHGTVSRPAPQLKFLLHLADYPDGGYILDINGHRTLPLLRGGMMLVITGKGFAARHPKSIVALFDGDQTTGATLTIDDWSDTRVVVEIPASQTVLIHSTLRARLLLQGVRNGFMTRYELKNLHCVVQG